MRLDLARSVSVGLCSLALFALLGARAPARADTAASCGCGAMFDCNDNGIEDAVDIATGSSSDADGNGVPDECDARSREQALGR